MVTTRELPLTSIGTASKLWMTEKEFATAFDEDTKAEWVGGEVIIMSPASTLHVRLAGFLLQIMNTFAKQQDLGDVLGPELTVRLAELQRRRVPDILFVAKARLDIIKENYVDGSPDLVVEIVSPDSLARDWREKYWEYETAGVQEYWIIDPMAQRVEAYTLDEEKSYQVIEETDNLIYSTVLPGFYLNTSWLWQEPLPKPLEILKELKVL